MIVKTKMIILLSLSSIKVKNNLSHF